jgi:hypothetical protein
MSFYALDKTGRHAGVSFYDGGSYAICSENGAQTFKTEPVYGGTSEES